MIYQLRLPASLGLDGFFTKIVGILEQSLGRPLNLELQGAVAQDLEKHILAFDTCGSSGLCDEATEPAEWNKGFDPVLLSSDPGDQDKVLRYHLNLPNDSLANLAGALARYIDRHLPSSDHEHRPQATSAVMDAVSPYLFFGEICRKTDLCKSAEPRPVKINLGEAA